MALKEALVTTTAEPATGARGGDLLRGYEPLIARLPRLRPAPPFLLRWKPGHWELRTDGLAKPRLLPRLSKQLLVAGVNLVKQVTAERNKREVINDAQIEGQRQGWIYLADAATLPASVLPAGVEPGPYIRPRQVLVPVLNAETTTYLEAWELPVLRDDAWTLSFDHGAYSRFLAYLADNIADMAVPPVTVVERVVQGAQTNLRRVENLRGLTSDQREGVLEPRLAVITQISSALAEDKRPEVASLRDGLNRRLREHGAEAAKADG